jgi:hypothetical protein
MAAWDAYQLTLESAVDDMFGEPIKLMPYNTGSYSTPAAPDNTRDVVDAVGIVVAKGSSLMAANSFISKRLDADLIIEIQEKYLTTTQANDRLQFLAANRNNLVCEISFIEPNTNGRPTLHLIKAKDNV